MANGFDISDIQSVFNREGPSTGDVLGPLSIISGLITTLLFGPEFGLGIVGSGLDIAQAEERNKRAEDIFSSFLPQISGGVEGLLSATGQPVLTGQQIESRIGMPGGAIQDIVSRLLPGLREQGVPTMPGTDIQGILGQARGQIGGLLGQERVGALLEPIRQQREQVLRGGRIEDPLALGKDIISEVGAEFGTPQAQFGIASEAATRLARQGVAARGAGRGGLEAGAPAREAAERAARLPIAAEAERSAQRSEVARAGFEGGLLQASGAQAQNINQRLLEQEAAGFDVVSEGVMKEALEQPRAQATLLAQLAGIEITGGLQLDQLTALIEQVGFENAVNLLGVETGAAAAAEEDKTRLLGILLDQGNIDRQMGVGGQTVALQTILNTLGAALGIPNLMVPLTPPLAAAGQQFAANKAVGEPEGGGFFGLGAAGGAGLGGLLAAPTGGLSVLGGALIGGGLGGAAGGTADLFR